MLRGSFWKRSCHIWPRSSCLCPRPHKHRVVAEHVWALKLQRQASTPCAIKAFLESSQAPLPAATSASPVAMLGSHLCVHEAC